MNFGKGENLTSRVVTLYYLKCSIETKNYDTGEVIGKYHPYIGGQINH